jgi:hypothetical protein
MVASAAAAPAAPAAPALAAPAAPASIAGTDATAAPSAAAAMLTAAAAAPAAQKHSRTPRRHQQTAAATVLLESDCRRLGMTPQQRMMLEHPERHSACGSCSTKHARAVASTARPCLQLASAWSPRHRRRRHRRRHRSRHHPRRHPRHCCRHSRRRRYCHCRRRLQHGTHCRLIADPGLHPQLSPPPASELSRLHRRISAGTTMAAKPEAVDGRHHRRPRGCRSPQSSRAHVSSHSMWSSMRRRAGAQWRQRHRPFRRQRSSSPSM